MKGSEKRRLSKLARHMDIGVHVGKDGLSEGLISEADRQLAENELIKVRLMRSARAGADRKDLARALAEATNADLVEVRGFTAVLYRPKGRTAPSAGS